MKKSSFSREIKNPVPSGRLELVLPLLLLLAIALSAAYAVNQYAVFVSQDFQQASAKSITVNLSQLENNYEHRLQAAVTSYLAAINLRSNEFLVKTKQLKEQLLALVVPAKYRDKHLAVVLALDQAEADSQQGDWQAVEQELEKIKQNCQSF